MEKSLRSAEYARLIQLLVATRHKAGIRQQALAKKLGKPQSFVAKFETGERRLDVIEFVTIAEALGADPVSCFAVSCNPGRDRLKSRPGGRLEPPGYSPTSVQQSQNR
ncbi:MULTISPECIES: helix-turn-helix transcriptional regulator [unclassified Bradyrhizobium]|uniref:helix-turn-helix domain-containing protein n=1 Tax=unclassified Bradyrhizobium TaxID=2631580 RepID=UPI00247B1DD2|nr:MULTISPECIES: helix-turn-helix transcriptional regulator [unclassified Bradyrhizobium]WGR73899.1 helix-turn-helix transcriptional regulator [Bradyrhizobium sp. ISRA426]WGR78736.1 helix-turn-helix transcriptional regulator [Bradyrhizobium sp. ISRA430]WGR89138.1 helix-turn-helix transcriptional regulator [Bradyrhizobium sp. ISRA432]